MNTLLAVLIALQPAPGLPTIPPPLPTYTVDADGTRRNCTPNYEQCWLPDVFE